MPHIRMTMPVELPEPEVIDVPALLRSCLSGETEMICVLGPTASGKTKYAVRLARRLNEILSAACRGDGATAEAKAFTLPGNASTVAPLPLPDSQVEIISADSRQVYVGMDIGSGKDLEEYGEIPVHLIDIAPAGSKYNVYRYQQDFARVYADIRQRGCIPLLCGGTGLYIEAAARGYDFGKDQPTVDPSLLPSRTYFIGTLVSREERNARIDARLRERLSHGLVEEVRGLLELLSI